MSASLGWQYAVIVALVAASALFMFRKLAPRLAARGQSAAARALMQPGRPGALRWLGQRLLPKAGAASGCGDGCSTCGACGSSDDARAAQADSQPLSQSLSQPLSQPLQFHRRTGQGR
jgi:hypothetical protein